MKVGDKVKLTKRTFLHTGIFVHTGSTVELLKLDGDDVEILYHDKEFNPHNIPLKISDIAPL